MPGRPLSLFTLASADGPDPDATVHTRVWLVTEEQVQRLVPELGEPWQAGVTTLGRLDAAQAATAGTYLTIESGEPG